MTEEAPEQFVGIGAIATALGVCPSSVRKWERRGVIPTAPRILGSDRRLYRLDDVPMIRQRVNAMRAARRRRRSDPVRAA